MLLMQFVEPFQSDPTKGIDPVVLIKTLKNLLNKYDDPKMLEHIMKVHTMDTGELARLEI